MTALGALRDAGFAVRLANDGRLGVTPADRLDDDVRTWIGEHRAEILDELRAEVGVVASADPGRSGPSGDRAEPESAVRGKLDAYGALLERDGYGGHPTRLPARVRRELARETGVSSLRAIGDDAEAWRRASAIVDGWIARLAADIRRGPLA